MVKRAIVVVVGLMAGIEAQAADRGGIPLRQWQEDRGARAIVDRRPVRIPTRYGDVLLAYPDADSPAPDRILLPNEFEWRALDNDKARDAGWRLLFGLKCGEEQATNNKVDCIDDATAAHDGAYGGAVVIGWYGTIGGGGGNPTTDGQSTWDSTQYLIDRYNACVSSCNQSGVEAAGTCALMFRAPQPEAGMACAVLGYTVNALCSGQCVQP